VINAHTSDPALLQTALVHPLNLGPPQRRSRTSPRCVKRTLSPYACNKTKGSVGRKTTVTTSIVLTQQPPRLPGLDL
jgi:hypothetical protein